MITDLKKVSNIDTVYALLLGTGKCWALPWPSLLTKVSM